MRRLTAAVLVVMASAASGRSARAQRTVTVVTRDYAFQMPDTIAAGVTTFQIRNEGTEPHEMTLVKLRDDQTLQDVLAPQPQGAPDPMDAQLIGGPAAGLPGSSESNATMALTEGRYAVVCGVPGMDGQPHSMKGMLKLLTVMPSKHTMALPTSDVTVTLTDYDFGFSRPVTAGRHTLRVVNAAQQAHQMILVRLQPNQTIDDVLTWAHTRIGPPPLVWSTGVAGIRGGGVAFVHADLPPGEYGLLCFLAATDGKAHVAHGMRKQFTVQ